MSFVSDSHDLPGDSDAHTFVGADHGFLPVSFFLVHSAPGSGPALHRHPYPEVFIIAAGRATFFIADNAVTATSGQIVVVPSGEPHRFINTGAETLRLTAVHPTTRMDTEWL